MAQSLKYVTDFLMYYTYMTLLNADELSNNSTQKKQTRTEFLFFFIGKA